MHSAAPVPMQMGKETASDRNEPVQLLPESRKFYEQLAVVAAIKGVCVDIYAVGPHTCGLSCLAPLCEKTGGVLNYYTSSEDALPQVQ